jgi:hypothetical protein
MNGTGKGLTMSGYFETANEDAISRALRQVDTRAPGVYLTINKIHPALLARASNRLRASDTTTADDQVIERRWLYIDVDPKKPAGIADISASDEEHRLAMEKAKAIRKFLLSCGWPLPIFIDSGNGAHLYYKLPGGLNPSEAEALVRQCLMALAAHFDDDRVKVDKGVFNASRIAKIPGTAACKGEDTADRPWRRSSMFDWPDKVEPVSLDLLKALVAGAPEPAKNNNATTGDSNDLADSKKRFEAWAADCGLNLADPIPSKGGYKYIVTPCPFNPQHGAKDAAFFVLASGAWWFHCFHESCIDKGWHEAKAQVEYGMPPGAKKSRPEPEPNAGPSASAADEWPEPLPLTPVQLPEFPAGLFPSWLGAHVGAVAEATETPRELAAMLDLAAAATAVQGKIKVEPEPGYTEPVNLFNVVALPSGHRKTAVYKKTTRPFIDWERKEQERLGPEIERLASERKTVEARVEKLRRQAAGSASEAYDKLVQQIAELEANKPEVPVVPRLWCDDITPERLAALMAEHGEKMAVFSNEGGIFDNMAGRYSRGVPNLPLFLKAHTTSPVRVDRTDRTKPPIFLREPHLTMGLCPQPGVIRALAEKSGFRSQGLIARVPYMLPASSLGYRKLEPRPVPADIEANYASGLFGMLAIACPVDHNEHAVPHVLRFDEHAYKAWKEFQRHIETEMRPYARGEDIQDWVSKLPGAVARIAGIFHAVKYVTKQPDDEASIGQKLIGEDTMESALDLGGILFKHALVAFDLMGGAIEMDDARRVLRWAEKNGKPEFTLRDCFCGNQSHFRQMDILRPAIRLLVDFGYLRLKPQGKVAHRPSETYLLNPKAAL